jgi:hypothetical protein
MKFLHKTVFKAGKKWVWEENSRFDRFPRTGPDERRERDVLYALGSAGDMTYLLTPHSTTLTAQPTISPLSVSSVAAAPHPPPPPSGLPTIRKVSIQEVWASRQLDKQASGGAANLASHTEEPFPGVFEAARDEGGDLVKRLRGEGSDRGSSMGADFTSRRSIGGWVSRFSMTRRTWRRRRRMCGFWVTHGSHHRQ